jgi:hypothetical protein
VFSAAAPLLVAMLAGVLFGARKVFAEPGSAIAALNRKVPANARDRSNRATLRITPTLRVESCTHA